MEWYPIQRRSAFSNLTLIGTAIEFVPHVIFVTLPNDNLQAYGMVASIISNITWSMGINFKVRVTSDGLYGNVMPDGSFTGAYADLKASIADISFSPMVRFSHIEDIFPSAYALNSINIRITSGMTQRYKKNVSFGNQALIQEIYPLLVAFLIVCVGLSTLFNVIFDQTNNWRKFLHIYVWSYIQAFFLEASNILGVRTNELTFSSKLVFGSFLIGVFLLSNYVQTSLKSSYMIEEETERIRSMKDIVDRPKLIPLMTPETPWFLKNSEAPYWREVNAQNEKFKPKSSLLFENFFAKSTLDLLTSRKAVLFTDEFAMMYMLPKLCPEHKGKYFYYAPEIPCSVLMTWYYRPGINRTLLKEIDKRYRWLEQAQVPWVPRFTMESSTHPCYVQPMAGESRASEEDQVLQVADLFWIFSINFIGCSFCCVCFVIEIIFFKIFD